MPYNKSATKTMNAMKKTYGSNWKRVYYALANKRAGKGLRGQHRGHRAANQAYAKGSHWGGKGRKTASRRRTRRSGHRVTVSTRGRANVTHRSGGAHIKVRVR